MGQVLVQLYWSRWSCGKDKFNSGSCTVCMLESGLLKKLGILRKEKRSGRSSLWNAILQYPWTLTFSPQTYWHLPFHFLALIKSFSQVFQRHWHIVGLKFLSLKDPDWQQLHRKLVPCRGAGWAGPGVHWKERGSLWSMWTRENTPDVEKEQGKGSAALLQSQPGKSTGKRHKKFRVLRSTLVSFSQLMFYSVHCMWPKKSHIMLNKTGKKKKKNCSLWCTQKTETLDGARTGAQSPGSECPPMCTLPAPTWWGWGSPSDSSKIRFGALKPGPDRVKRKGRRHSRDCSVTHIGGKAEPWHTFPTGRSSLEGRACFHTEQGDSARPEEMRTEHENNTPGAE